MSIYTKPLQAGITKESAIAERAITIKISISPLIEAISLLSTFSWINSLLLA